MSIVADMSDEGLVRQFGDLMHELPELFEAMRRFEMQNRLTLAPGGFKMRAGRGSVERGDGGVLRVQVGNPGR